MNKTTFFDSIFKPERMELPNGKFILRKRSRLPLIIILTVAVIVLSLQFTNFDFMIIAKRINQLGVIFGKIFNPNWSYLEKVWGPLIDTIQMSFIGTIVGVLIGLPVAVLSSSNINQNKVIVSFLRFILGIVRTVPTLIMATITPH